MRRVHLMGEGETLKRRRQSSGSERLWRASSALRGTLAAVRRARSPNLCPMMRGRALLYRSSLRCSVVAQSCTG